MKKVEIMRDGLAIMCQRGNKSISKADAKMVENFGKFLAGQGHRCDGCFHKRKHHAPDGCSKCACLTSPLTIDAFDFRYRASDGRLRS